MDELFTICQDQRNVMDYAVEFQILATCSGWPDAPLADAFLHALADHVKDMLIAYDRP